MKRIAALTVSTIMMVCVFALLAWGQGAGGGGGDVKKGAVVSKPAIDKPTANKPSADTSIADTSIINTSKIDAFADSSSTNTPTDTSAAAQANADIDDSSDFDSLDHDDALDFVEAEAADSAASQETSKLGVVRREHSYARQVKLAIVMMTFIIVAMATSQSWNPR